MGRARRWFAGSASVALLAIGIPWLLGPADPPPEDDAPSPTSDQRGAPGLAAGGRRPAPTRLDALIGWIRRQLEGAPEPEPPPMPFEAPVALGAPGTLEVVVRDEAGPPIPGARVVVFGPPGAPVVPPAVTDAEGLVGFAALPAGPGYSVHADASSPLAHGGTLAPRRVAVAAGTTTRLVLDRPSFRVEVEVRDAETGDVVAGAHVEAFDAADALAARGRDARARWAAVEFGAAATAPRVALGVTAPDGRFLLDLGPREAVELRARTSDGRTGARLVQRGSSSRPTRVDVRAARRCQGTVVDAAGRPQPGLRVSAPAGITRAHDGPSTTTDGAGHFALPVVGAGPSVRLVVEGEAVPRFSTRAPVELDARIVVPGAARLDVRVVEDDGGAPVADAHLLATVGSTTTEGTTGADGRRPLATTPGPISALRVFASGVPELIVDAGSPGAATVEPSDALVRPLGAGETRSVTVRVRRGAVVVGRVLHPDGRPAADVDVRLTTGWSGPTPTARSGPDGRFAVPGCLPPPPTWTLGVRVRLTGGVAGSAEAVVPPAATAHDTIDLGDVQLRRGTIVRARVLDPDDRPIPTASARGNLAALADADGWLTMDVPAGMAATTPTLAFDVAAPGFRTREVRCAADLRPGEVRDLPPIRLVRGARAAVRVLDAEGRPVAGCEVRWAWNGDRTPVRTDAEGRATLSGAPNDEERVHVTLPDGAVFHRHGALPPATGDAVALELRLPPTRTLVVRVSDALDAPIPLASVSTSRTTAPPGGLAAEEPWASTDGRGLARLASVVAAPVRLRVRAPGFVAAEVAVEAAATSVAVPLEAIGDAARRRLAEALAALERVERELRAQAPDDDGEEARARFRLQRKLQDECDRLRGR